MACRNGGHCEIPHVYSEANRFSHLIDDLGGRSIIMVLSAFGRRIFRGVLALVVVLAMAPVASTPSQAAQEFPDVPRSSTFYTHIVWLSEEGITSGYANGDFGPNDPVTRGQMAAFLYKLAGSPRWNPPTVSPFRDVSTSNVFYKHITWLAAQGITSGVGDGTRFAPNQQVSRGQMAAFLYKLAGSPAFSAPGRYMETFPDVSTSYTFYKHIEWLAAAEITGGYGNGTFGPSDPVTRGQMAAFLHKFSPLLGSASFGEGVWPVGDDVSSGTYRVFNEVGEYCYWSINSYPGSDDIVQNDIVTGGIPTVRLSAGQEFESNGCGIWLRYTSLDTSGAAATRTEFSEGVWLVGADIVAGTYRTANSVSGYCYWEIMAGAGSDDIIDNDIVVGGRPTVVLENGREFDSYSCGKWVRVG